jgi:hypothetical protein
MTARLEFRRRERRRTKEELPRFLKEKGKDRTRRSHIRRLTYEVERREGGKQI